MYVVGICDDQEFVCEMIREKVSTFLLKRDIDIRFHSYNSGEALLKESIKFDILFLDIELVQENGLDVARDYPHKKRTRIIFLTFHVEEMPNGYKVRAFRFLTKPINQEYFEEAILSAIKDIDQEKCIAIKDEDGDGFIYASEIMYVEATGRIASIRTMDNYVKAKVPFHKLMEELPPLQFYNSHRSYIVNMDYICRIDNYQVILENNEKVKVSRLKNSHFKTVFFNYIRRKTDGN